jgi:hypothetical protein
MIDARFPFLLGTALAVTPLVSAACSSNDKMTGVADAKLPQGMRGEAIDHEGCDESGNRVEMLDTNNDGKPDIRRVFDKKTGHELCRVVDLNHDGKPDLYEYFDAAGTIRRREFCYDDTGVVNGVEYYENGKLARRELDTTGQHRIDTWDWFDTNAPLDAKTRRPAHPVRRERDTRGSGHADQWWTWSGDKVTIAVDNNGDGKPDPASALVLGGDDDAGASPGASGNDGGAPASDGGGAPVAASDDAGTVTEAAADGGKP